MTHGGFDATITLNDHHLATAGLVGRNADAVTAVREAVGRLPGAGWIDVEAHYFPPALPGWVIIYPAGRSGTPDTPAWQDLRRTVEQTALAALIEAGGKR